jgi:hypothetical protein
MIAKTIRIIKKDEERSDYLFWKTRSYEARLQTLEKIREEYNNWKYGSQQRFQRVYKVIKRI